MLAAGCWLPAAGSPDACRVHPSELLLELGDLVAEPGRELELQLGGGRPHLVVELLDQVGQRGPREVAYAGAANGAIACEGFTSAGV